MNPYQRRFVRFVVCPFVFFVVFVFVSFVVAQEPLPRFRAGANLVTVDAYFAKDGKPVIDLKPDDIEVREDDQPQAIENFRIVHVTGQGAPRSKPEPTSVAAIREATADPEARIFALFFDTWHVSFEGSSKAAAPVSTLLNRIVGANDLVGVTTPDLPARGLSLTHRTEAIERITRDTVNWSQRDRVGAADPREAEIALCYPENDLRRPQFRGIAKEMIERRRGRAGAIGDRPLRAGVVVRTAGAARNRRLRVQYRSVMTRSRITIRRS